MKFSLPHEYQDFVSTADDLLLQFKQKSGVDLLFKIYFQETNLDINDCLIYYHLISKQIDEYPHLTFSIKRLWSLELS